MSTLHARGIDSLTVEDMRMFLLVFCHKCGAIHGVIPSPNQPSTVNTQTGVTADNRPSPKIINIDPQTAVRGPQPGVSFPNRPPEADQPETRPVFVKNGS